MPRAVADLSRCEGYANCLMTDPERYDLDDDGRVRLLREDVAPDEVERVQEAIRSCPTQALGLER